MPILAARTSACERWAGVCSTNPQVSHTRFSQADFERQGKHLTYLALGLSRRFRGKHWLIVIGVHTIPELDVLIDWEGCNGSTRSTARRILWF